MYRSTETPSFIAVRTLFAYLQLFAIAAQAEVSLALHDLTAMSDIEYSKVEIVGRPTEKVCLVAEDFSNKRAVRVVEFMLEESGKAEVLLWCKRNEGLNSKGNTARFELMITTDFVRMRQEFVFTKFWRRRDPVYTEAASKNSLNALRVLWETNMNSEQRIERIFQGLTGTNNATDNSKAIGEIRLEVKK